MLTNTQKLLIFLLVPLNITKSLVATDELIKFKKQLPFLDAQQKFKSLIKLATAPTKSPYTSDPEEPLPNRKKSDAKSHFMQTALEEFKIAYTRQTEHQNIEQQLQDAQKKFDILINAPNKSVTELCAECLEFFDATIKPLRKHYLIKEHYPKHYMEHPLLLDSTAFLALQNTVVVCYQFLKRIDSPIQSPAEFAALYTSFEVLPNEYVPNIQTKLPKLFSAALEHGALPNQLVRIYTKLPINALEKTHAQLGEILRTKKGNYQWNVVTALSQLTGYQQCMKHRAPQASGLWYLKCITALTADDISQFLHLHKNNNIIDNSLAMQTIQPLLGMHAYAQQKIFYKLLDLWLTLNGNTPPQRTSMLDMDHLKERFQNIITIINSNNQFKKALECGAPLVKFWLGYIYATVYSAEISKLKDDVNFNSSKINSYSQNFYAHARYAEQLLGQLKQTELQLLLLEEDNIYRLKIHSDIIRLLLKHPSCDTKYAKEICIRALQAGVNVANDDCLEALTKKIKLPALLKLIEPYLKDNPDLSCSMAILYEQGGVVSTNTSRAKELYGYAIEHGHYPALTHYLHFVGPDQLKRATFCVDLCEKFPHNYPFLIQKIVTSCRALSVTVPEAYNASEKCTEMAKDIALLDKHYDTLTPKQRVHYSAAKTSFFALEYQTYKQDQYLKKLYQQGYSTFCFSLDPEAKSLSLVASYFDPRVLASCIEHAGTLLNNQAAPLSDEQVRFTAFTGYLCAMSYAQKPAPSPVASLLEHITTITLNARTVPSLAYILGIRKELLKENESKEDSDIIYGYIKQTIHYADKPSEVPIPQEDLLAYTEGMNTLEMKARSGQFRAQLLLLSLIYKESLITNVLAHLDFTRGVSPEELPACIQFMQQHGYEKLKCTVLKNKDASLNATLLNARLTQLLKALLYFTNKDDIRCEQYYDDLAALEQCRESKKNSTNAIGFKTITL